MLSLQDLPTLHLVKKYTEARFCQGEECGGQGRLGCIDINKYKRLREDTGLISPMEYYRANYQMESQR